MKILVSGYTKDQSKGIYQFELRNGRMTNLKLLAKVKSPTYMKLDLRRGLLFTVDKDQPQRGGIAAFHYKNGRAKLADRFLSPGPAPAYISINPKNMLMYTANYHTGLICVFSYQPNGKLKLLASKKLTAQSLGPRPEQDAPHPHFFAETPAGNLAAADLGNDTVSFFRLKEGELQLLARYHNHAGFGSRHLAFAADDRHFYVVGELSSEINEVGFDEQNWHFQDLGYLSTIPHSFIGSNSAAALRISSDGRFIYVSNRGHNSLAIFKTGKVGLPQLVQRISTFGSFPRDFNWDKEERLLIAVNQKGGNATLYRRNRRRGSLAPIQKDFSVPEATCVLFAEDENEK